MSARFCSRLAVAFALAVLLPLGIALCRAADMPTGPQLRLETGTHTATIDRLSIAGSLVATASDDKTVRLWSIATGEARGVVRIPVGQGTEGELYAVALSPDGTVGVAGGFTCSTWDDGFCLYVFNPQTGRLRGRFPHLPDAINYLAYSPDGSRLVAGLGGRSGIVVFDGKSFAVLNKDDKYANRVTWVAFDRAGRFATASFDGFIRLYSASGALLVPPRVAPGGKQPFSVAFSPDGTLLAVGYADRSRVDVLSAIDLGPRYVATTAEGEGFSAVVAWSGGDAAPTLNAAGTLRDKTHGYVLRRWPDAGRGTPTDVVIATNTVNDLEPVAGGGVAFASSDASWGVVDKGGRLVVDRKGLIDDLSATLGQGIAVSADGSVVEFATARGGGGIMRFDLLRRTLTSVAAFDPALARASNQNPTVRVANWAEGQSPQIGGRPVILDKEERTHSLAIAPSGRQVLLGSDYYLRLFDHTGALLKKLDMPAAVWGLAIDHGGDRAVAALGDGTIRWLSLRPGKELTSLLTLFPVSDGHRWIAWTPEGFFDHADDGGKELVGYQFNRGKANTPDWVNFAQLYRVFYAPELLTAKLAGQEAALTERLGHVGDVPTRLVQAALPKIDIVGACVPGKTGEAPVCQDPKPTAAGGQGLTVPSGSDRLTIRFRITDQGGGVGPVDFFNNARSIGRIPTARDLQLARGIGDGGSTPPAGTILAEREIPLDAGRNKVAIRAYDGTGGVYGVSTPLDIDISAPPTTTPAGATTAWVVDTTPHPAATTTTTTTTTTTVAVASDKPHLFILAAAVNAYKDPVPQLDLAVADAKTFVQTMVDHSPGIYAPQPFVIELYDRDATSDAIDDGFRKIAAQAETRDTILVYLAGHGDMIEDKYYFVPQEFDMSAATTEDELHAALRKQGYTGGRLVENLSRIKAKNGFVFLDTCHSGALSLDAGASQINHESGRYVLTASTSVQLALDSFDGHNGLLAYAVKEALSKATPDAQGVINNFTLGFYVSHRVAELAAMKHYEQSAHFKIATDDAQPFPIAEVR